MTIVNNNGNIYQNSDGLRKLPLPNYIKNSAYVPEEASPQIPIERISLTDLMSQPWIIPLGQFYGISIPFPLILAELALYGHFIIRGQPGHFTIIMPFMTILSLWAHLRIPQSTMEIQTKSL
ncbi:hypothetical protein O181_047062 [Austropuccinia psidii MF-1]|uniref:Uncharacterized protein n=1 Tax=Austropuccinia psidii MF-1 TaxID=1389203 RepID=A0A9Q3DX41_9BASI|nr:hypothetical protein [Austropuccinia psidii MF-1]